MLPVPCADERRGIESTAPVATPTPVLSSCRRVRLNLEGPNRSMAVTPLHSTASGSCHSLTTGVAGGSQEKRGQTLPDYGLTAVKELSVESIPSLPRETNDVTAHCSQERCTAYRPARRRCQAGVARLSGCRADRGQVHAPGLASTLTHVAGLSCHSGPRPRRCRLLSRPHAHLPPALLAASADLASPLRVDHGHLLEPLPHHRKDERRGEPAVWNTRWVA